MNTRTIAANIMIDLIQYHCSLDQALSKHLGQINQQNQKGFVQEICYGVARFYPRLRFFADQLITKPLREKDQDIYILVLIGLYQLLYMHVPNHAAVNETVNAARAFKKKWAISFVNAVLQNFIRKKETLVLLLEQNIEAKTAHPRWMINEIKKAWTDDYKNILAINNQHPPMSLRVNQQQTNREEYLQKLKQVSIESSVSSCVKGCITLNTPCSVELLPDFKNGAVSVQDCSAQFAATLLDLKPGQRVLDACAAPGGKTTHLLEVEPKLKQLIAVDQDEKRLLLVRDNLERLKMKADLICADVGETKRWWDGELFDRILLDAPCSSTGVIRRHPDIKLLRREKDIETLARIQLKLLQMLWPLLNVNGILLYVTCSIFSKENEQVVSEFIKQHANSEEIKIKISCSKSLKHGIQILPQENMDGFYYAKLKKTIL